MSTASSAVGVIVDGWMDRLARGERIDPTPEFAAYPELADRLRGLLSAIGVVAAIPADPGKPVLPGYRIVREIGRGGMGVVYEAVDETLGRRVAVKVLPPHLSGHPDYLARFRREARTAAALHHTHIVPVFGVGEHAGVHFFVMQFIPGRPASADMALSPGLAADRLADLGAKLADALACAHAAGVLHRDIKPGNVLIDEAGEPWLADFGLARVETDGGQTDPDAVVGTLRYTAPERFAGVTDARSDVYALGLTLYELATGRPAFDGPDRATLLKAILETDPPRPRSIDPAIPRDLETVLLKAIARDPAQRYATAADFADDLRRVRDGLPILAQRIGPLGQLRRWAARHPVIAGLAAALFVALTAGTTVSTWQWRRAAANLVQAEENERQAKRANEKKWASLRSFYRGMDKFPEFFIVTAYTGGGDLTPEQVARQAEAFKPLSAVYAELLAERTDDQEVIELQARASYQLGVFETKFQHFPEACGHFRRAVELAPGGFGVDADADLHENWAFAVSRVGPDSQAVRDFDRIREHHGRRLVVDPDDVRAKLGLANLWSAWGIGPLFAEHPAASLAALRESLRLNDELPPVLPESLRKKDKRTFVAGYVADQLLRMGDLPACEMLADSRAQRGEWLAAAKLWVKCGEAQPVPDRDDRFRHAVELLNQHTAAHGPKRTLIATPELKPLANRPDYKAWVQVQLKSVVEKLKGRD